MTDKINYKRKLDNIVARLQQEIARNYYDYGDRIQEEWPFRERYIKGLVKAITEIEYVTEKSYVTDAQNLAIYMPTNKTVKKSLKCEDEGN